MLTPEYLDTCADEVLGLYDGLQTSIAQDIAKSLVKNGEIISSAGWQAQRLQSSGELLQDIIKDVTAYSGLSAEEVNRAFYDAAQKGLLNDADPLVKAGLMNEKDLMLSQSMKDSLDATIAKCNGNLRNLTLTTGSTAQGLYLSETNLAYMKVQSGAYSYQQAIADAIRNSAKEGAWVTYGMRADGSIVHSRLDVAVRRSVLTGINQTCGQLTEMWAAEMGVEYYEVSAHLGARPSHQEWEGQVYKIEGSDKDYKNFYEETGYGTGDGLCGYNCRHSFYPFWPGISKRNYTDKQLKTMQDRSYEYEGQTLSEYECQQTQRAYERAIREDKRILASYDAAMEAAAGDRSLYDELKSRFDSGSVKLKQTERQMKQFCAATNRRVDSARTQVYAYKDDNGNIVHFGRSTSAKAVWADRKSG